MTKVAVAGLGSMGFGMASSCLRAGLPVWGIDLNPDAVARLVAAGGEAGDLPPDIDVLVTVVVNAVQTEAVLFGDGGLAARLPRGAVVLSCATVAPEAARALAARCADAGLGYLDAPISGGPERSANGALSILLAGDAAHVEAARPVLDACAANVFEMGPAIGAGSAMKAVNQLLVGVQIAAAAEALAFGMTQGIDPQTFLDTIPKCAGTSWALENRVPHIVAGDYAPKSAVDIWPKDLGIVLDIAKAAGFSTPITAAAFQQYMVAVGMGLGREDDAAIAKVYARNAGLTLPGEAR